MSTSPSTFDVRIRLVPDDPTQTDARQRGDALPFADGLLQTLALRTDDGEVSLLTAAEVNEQGWDLKSTWANAWAQTRTLERPHEANVIDAGGVDIIHLYSNDPFGASFVPFLHDVLGNQYSYGEHSIGSHGALVSIPVEQSIIVHPIRGGDIVRAAQTMIPITRGVHRSGPGSLSAQVYWWQNGVLTLVPTYFARDGIEFYPSPELAALIDQVDDVI